MQGLIAAGVTSNSGGVCGRFARRRRRAAPRWRRPSPDGKMTRQAQRGPPRLPKCTVDSSTPASQIALKMHQLAANERRRPVATQGTAFRPRLLQALTPCAADARAATSAGRATGDAARSSPTSALACRARRADRLSGVDRLRRRCVGNIAHRHGCGLPRKKIERALNGARASSGIESGQDHPQEQIPPPRRQPRQRREDARPRGPGPPLPGSPQNRRSDGIDKGNHRRFSGFPSRRAIAGAVQAGRHRARIGDEMRDQRPTSPPKTLSRNERPSCARSVRERRRPGRYTSHRHVVRHRPFFDEPRQERADRAVVPVVRTCKCRMTSAAVQAPACQIGSMTSHSESEI